MRLVMETERLRNLIRAGLIYKGKKGLMESFVGRFGDKGLVFGDISLDIAGVYGVYPKIYFSEYECNNEDIPLTHSLLEGLETGFTMQKVTFDCDKKEMIVRSETEKYREKLLDKEFKTLPFEMTYTGVGYVPKKMIPKVQVQLLSDELSSLPDADEYAFICDGTDLKAEVKGVGVYTKVLDLKKRNNLESLTTYLDGETFKHIISNLYADVWFSLHENGVVLSQKFEDYALTYIQASKEAPL